MKVTEQMIDAACAEVPHLRRDDVSMIVQAALNSHVASGELEPNNLRTILGIVAISIAFSLVPFIGHYIA